MVQPADKQQPRILEYLRNLAPLSVVDRGIEIAASGGVSECSRSGNLISAVIKDKDEDTFSISLEIIAGKRVEARCRCSSDQEMQEQWCRHAVAGLWQAGITGFFEPLGGFASSESVFRMNVSSPNEIAEAIRDLQQLKQTQSAARNQITPEVELFLSVDRDRLGIQVRFDQETQEPCLFDQSSDRSSRALDNVLLQSLDDQGTWDDRRKLWYLSSSSDIELMLGLMEEYGRVISLDSGNKVQISDEQLDACLEITWQESAAELRMLWVLPGGEKRYRQSPLFGTGPYWSMIDDTIYRVSPMGARIASIFPNSSQLTLPKSQTGPILEALEAEEEESFIITHHPENRPTSERKSPKPLLQIEKREAESEHFTSQGEVSLIAQLEYSYPVPPPDQNVVYVRDLEQEQLYHEHLVKLGFQLHREREEYSIVGDHALNLLQKGKKSFSPDWEIEGLQQVRNQIRFASLELNVALTTLAEEDKQSPQQSGIDWFDCHISLTQNQANVPISMLFKQSGADDRSWIRLDNGAFARVPTGQLGRLKSTLGLIDPGFRLSNTIKTQISAAQALGLTSIQDDLLQLSIDKNLQQLARKLKTFEKIEQIKPGRNFKGKLRNYQSEGLSWLNFLRQFQLSGILADEMGLGKTVQTLALLQYVVSEKKKKRKKALPSLIVAPTSVITNWIYECRRFVPELKVLLLHGPQRKALFKSLEEYDIIITSYALLRLDRHELERLQFEYIVLDEAQNIKNPLAATTKAAKSLRCNFRLALSGTPTENRPLELWSLFDFLMPGYLGSVDFFRTQIERPIMDGTEAGVEASQLLHGKTKPFILRRMKAEVEKDLPEKIESELHVEMTPSQQQLYAEILEEVRPKVLDAVKKKGVRGATISILSALLRLRQICNHPNSIDSMKDQPGYDSGKFELLKDILAEALESGRKILLFSQFREMLAIIQRHLETINLNYLYLDGATKNRADLIDEFNQNDEVRLFLISLKAGGTGLNLTAADTVIIYDPWWNPAVESQAVDRAHRIGQTKAVTVYRLVTENSIEQKIMQLKEKKEKIVDSLLNDTTSPLRLTQKELQNLFELELPRS